MSEVSPESSSMPGSDRERSACATHRVINQAVPLEGHNAFTCDPVLQEGLRREGASWAASGLESFGELCAKPEVIELIQKDVIATNEKFARVEHISKFRLIPKELDHEDGELTATQKVKRSSMMDMFGDLVEDMYR